MVRRLSLYHVPNFTESRVYDSALAALDPFRPEPYSAISEGTVFNGLISPNLKSFLLVPKDGWEMNMDIDPKTPRLEQEEPELIERAYFFYLLQAPAESACITSSQVRCHS